MFLRILLCLLGLSVVSQSEDDIFSEKDKRSIEVRRSVKFSNPVRFYINNRKLNKLLIKKALIYLNNHTCLKFKEYTKELPSDGINFLLKDELAVFNDRYKEKLSFVHLTEKCSEELGCIKHMIGRAFGLQLETSRHDRDKYVTINWDRIDEKFKSLYQKKKGRNNRIFNTAFDYGSIMMPEISFGSKNGRNSYEVLKSPSYIHMVGQREEFSHNDLKKINDVYCKGLCVRKFKGCKHGGYFSCDSGVCNCPPGYAGETCTKIAKSVGYCGRKNRLFATESKRRLVLKGRKKCVIAIDTRAGRNVALVVEKVETEKLLPCVQNKGLEIKYRYDKGATGLVLCGSYRNISIPPTFSRTLLIYHGLENNHEVRISYREVKRRK